MRQELGLRLWLLACWASSGEMETIAVFTVEFLQLLLSSCTKQIPNNRETTVETEGNIYTALSLENKNCESILIFLVSRLTVCNLTQQKVKKT